MARPLLRAVGGLLLLACTVFVFVAPTTIARVNRLTGVPNISAPWCYSLLTAFCASCLLLIIAWRNGLSDRSAATRRAMRWVVSLYSGVIVALWVLFFLADASEERLRDLDTYYATTPFMREQILLYLLAHTVAVLITCRLLWNWVQTAELDAWLRWGLKFLGVGYALNIVFDAAKLTAVAARWTGHDLDWLSTDLAPPVACLSAILIAVGFILPHAGQYLHERWHVRLAFHRLRPLYLLMRSADGRGVPFLLRATPELRLIRRETFIRDELLTLARHIDEERRDRAREAALGLGFPPERARRWRTPCRSWRRSSAAPRAGRRGHPGPRHHRPAAGDRRRFPGTAPPPRRGGGPRAGRLPRGGTPGGRARGASGE